MSYPYPLRFLFVSQPAIRGQVLGIVYRVIATHLIKKAGFTCQTVYTGAMTWFDQSHPGTRPDGRPVVIQIGFAADLSRSGSDFEQPKAGPERVKGWMPGIF